MIAYVIALCWVISAVCLFYMGSFHGIRKITDRFKYLYTPGDKGESARSRIGVCLVTYMTPDGFEYHITSDTNAYSTVSQEFAYRRDA